MENRARIMGMRSRAPALLLAAVLLLVLFLLSYLLSSAYRQQIHEAEVSTRNLATLLETRLYETLRRADADLAALAAELPTESLDARNVSRFQQDVRKRLASRLVNVECIDGLYVVDAQGRVLYSSSSNPLLELNVAESAYFATLYSDPGTALVFSDVVNGGTAGGDVLVVARVIRGGDGRFLGAVLGPLGLTSFREQFAALDIGANGFVAWRRRDDDRAVVEWPDLMAADSPGKVQHIASFKEVTDYPFYFVVGVSRAGVLAGWYPQVIVVGFTVLLAIALVGRLVMRLGRMRAREVVILSDLAHRESQFSELVQTVPVGIARFDTAGKCVFVNECNLAITGRTREELVGSDWSGTVHPDDWLLVGPFWNGEAGDSAVRTCEYRLVRPDGRIVDVIGETRADRTAEGIVVGHIVAQTDVSALKDAQKELMRAKQAAERANQAKSRFLAAASHDLRQPIQAIDLFKEALCRTELNDEQKNIAGFLSLSVRSLSGLIYSLLDISKLDAGLVRPQIKTVAVENVFEALDEEFSSLAQQKNLRFKFFYPFEGPALETDRTLLLTILRNLIDNALKYTNSGGILIGFRRRGDSGVIQVWDTGIGIDPVFGDKVFEECFQVGNSTQNRAKGLGIGLSIARRTARLIGGDVSYHSRPGRGSVFEITVPLSVRSSGTHAPAPEAEGQAPGEIDCSRIRGWKVVVVEDDPVVAKSIELSLNSVGISTCHFGSAEEAMEAPSLLDADFYISDFVLPGRNGVELLDAIQSRSARAINAVLMTGETSPDRMESASAAGWNVLLKPAGLSNLLSVMANVGATKGAACRN